MHPFRVTLLLCGLIVVASALAIGVSAGAPKSGYGRHYLATTATLRLDDGRVRVAPDKYVQVEALEPVPQRAPGNTPIRVRVVSVRAPDQPRVETPAYLDMVRAMPKVGEVGTVIFLMLD